MTETFWDVIRAALEGSSEADPLVAADAALEDFTPEQQKAAARHGARQAARQLAHTQRVRRYKPSSPKWDGYAQTVREWPEIFSRRICVAKTDDGAGVWKFLGECDRRDLLGAAELRDELAAAIGQEAERFRALAEELPDDEVSVETLDVEVVEWILGHGDTDVE